MNCKNENGVLTLFPEGRIDTSNAAKVEEEINSLRESNQHTGFIIDVENVEYISSAGLRILLRLLKVEKDMKIINASSEVYDVFEMTGFTEMVSIEKAYRRVSVDGCEVIGQGANGKVYRLDEETIIKVYMNSDSLPDIHRERELARKAFVAGIPTAIPYDVVKVGDSYGSVFEMLNAQPFSVLMKNEPDKLDYYAGLYVDILKKIHSTQITDGSLPDMRQTAIGWVNDLDGQLPAQSYEKLKKMIEDVPEDNHMMHGDYHVKNVMKQKDEVLLIDMDTLCIGNPVFEFASIYLAYIGFSDIDSENVSKFIGLPIEITRKLWRKTLELYFESTDDEFLNKMADKAMIPGYVRLLRRTIRRQGDTEYGKKMIENCKNKLTALLERIDSIAY